MLSTLSKTARLSQTRFLRLSHSAAAKDAKQAKKSSPAEDSPSFVMNLFRGKAVSTQVKIVEIKDS